MIDLGSALGTIAPVITAVGSAGAVLVVTQGIKDKLGALGSYKLGTDADMLKALQDAYDALPAHNEPTTAPAKLGAFQEMPKTEPFNNLLAKLPPQSLQVYPLHSPNPDIDTAALVPKTRVPGKSTTYIVETRKLPTGVVETRMFWGERPDPKKGGFRLPFFHRDVGEFDDPTPSANS